jgi:hypothetical protein
MDRNELILRESYQVVKIFARNMESVNHSEIVKDCVLVLRSAALSNYQRNKQIVEEVRRLQLPHSTCARNVEHLSQNQFSALLLD